MVDTARHDRWLTAGVAVLLVAVGGMSLWRAGTGRWDFEHFYLDARYVWMHGTLNPEIGPEESPTSRRLPFYLPTVPTILAPLAAGGRWPAAVVWAAVQVVSLGYALRAMRRWARPVQSEISPVLVATVIFLFALPAIIEAAKFNQLSFPILALVLFGVERLYGVGCSARVSPGVEEDGHERAGGSRGPDVQRPARRRPLPLNKGGWLAGAAFGFAAVLKLLPVVFLPWLMLRRRWSASVWMVVGAGAIAVLPPLIAFGPQQAMAYHGEWWSYNRQSAGGRLGPELEGHFIDHRNQSIGEVLARTTAADHPHALPWQPLALDAAIRRGITAVLTGGLFVGLLAATAWRRNAQTSVLQLRAEFAAYAIAMLVLAPLLRTYYLVWALPGLMVLGTAAAEEVDRRIRRLGQIGVWVWLLGMAAWLWPAARLCGVHLVMLIVMGVALLSIARIAPRRSAA